MSDLSDSKQKPIFTATQNDAGQRVDNYLLKRCKQLNKGSCYKLIRKGQIRINGKRVKPLQKLITGDQIRVPPFVFFVDQKTNDVPDSSQQKLLDKIIFEDDDYLVLDKPAGIPCHTGTGHKYGVVEIIKSLPNYADIQLAHRLDKDTSGCLLLAKNRQALLKFQQALKLQNVSKTYLAVLEGKLTKSIEVSQPLDAEHRVNGIRTVVVSKQGKPAQTLFTAINQKAGFTLVECQISTGRTHQIRAHAQFLNLPIFGDTQYGSKRTGAKRKMYLHAYKLQLNELIWTAPKPSCFFDLQK